MPKKYKDVPFSPVKVIIPRKRFRKIFTEVADFQVPEPFYNKMLTVLDVLEADDGISDRDQITKNIYAKIYVMTPEIESFGEAQHALVTKVFNKMRYFLRMIKCDLYVGRKKNGVPAKVAIQRRKDFFVNFPEFRIEKEDYVVVYRYGKTAGGWHGVMFHRSYKSKKAFFEDYGKIREICEIVVDDISRDEAEELCKDTPFPCRLAACVEQCIEEDGKFREAIFVELLRILNKKHADEFATTLKKAGIIS